MEKLSTEQFVSKINTIGKNLAEKFMQNSLPLNVKEYGDHFVVKYEEVKKQKVSVEKTFNELMVEKFDCELTNFTYSDKEPVQFFIRIFPILFCNKAIDNDFEVTIGFKIKFLPKPRPNDFVEAWDSCKNLISVLVRNYGFESIPRTQITEYTMEIYKPIYTKKLFESFGTDAQKKYIDKQKEEKKLLSIIFSKKYNFNSEKESKTPKAEIKNGKPSESKNMNFGNYQTTEEDFWGFDSAPKKLNVGDSVKVNGRVGIVEDYDENYYYVKDDNTNIVKIKKIKDDNQELKNKFSYCKQDLDRMFKGKDMEIYSAYNGPDFTYYGRWVTKRKDFTSDNWENWAKENIENPTNNLMKKKYPNFIYDMETILLNDGTIGVKITLQAKDSANIKDFSRLAYEYEPEEDFELEEENSLSEKEQKRIEAEKQFTEENSEEEDVLKYFREKNLSNDLNKFMDEFLTEKEKKVLELSFGLNGEKPHTENEIGEKFNVTASRIHAIKQRALNKLKYNNNIVKKQLSPYLYN